MRAPINQCSEQTRRAWAGQSILQADHVRPEPDTRPESQPDDPEYHAGAQRGAPVAWMLLAVIFAVAACGLLLALREWLSAGNWLR